MTQPPDFLIAYGEARAEFWRNPPRGECPVCHTEDVILHPQDEGEHESLCTSCSRSRIMASKTHREFTYPCDRCGGGAAFRDPLHRQDVYLCASCHEEDGYLPGERAMVSQIEKRVGYTHSRGRRDVCDAAGRGTECRGEVKPRGKSGILCTFHHNPRLYR